MKNQDFLSFSWEDLKPGIIQRRNRKWIKKHRFHYRRQKSRVNFSGEKRKREERKNLRNPIKTISTEGFKPQIFYSFSKIKGLQDIQLGAIISGNLEFASTNF